VSSVSDLQRGREGSPVDMRGQLLTDPPLKSAWWRWGADIRAVGVVGGARRRGGAGGGAGGLVRGGGGEGGRDTFPVPHA
jgi:hypothetical protein